MSWALMLFVGFLVGEWISFAGSPSPAALHTRALTAWEQHDYEAALRFWNQAVAVRPDNPLLQYHRGTALARLGHRQSAEDAYRLALLLDPPAAVARQVRESLTTLAASVVAGATETTVVLEPSRGVWVAAVAVNGERTARFLLDTGSSVTIVAPALATALRLTPSPARESMELQTLTGQTVARTVRLASVRVGMAELRDVPAVIHEPGADLDGILGNTFLSRYRLTLDADRRLLHLRRPTTD